ncbi:MAG: xanthine dehydrogenase family protein subunit M [Synergistaceae bacterium]|nr:xanthine dehydrogenase family protein subunit M [Synergistaceae bacterium]
MYLPDFDYYAPESVSEALDLLTEHKENAKVICGGTDLLPKMKHELLAPKVLISIKKLPNIKKIEYVKGKGISIGAAATHNEIVFSEVVNSKYPSICNAAAQMAANQVRHVGTIGGNIVSAVPSADLPPILIALGATAKIAGPGKERVIPLEDVFTGPQQNCLEANELLTEIFIPDGDMTCSTYHKFALRRAGALAVVGVAVALQTKGCADGACSIEDARIVYGAVAPTPMRGVKAEAVVKGKMATDDVFEEAGKVAYSECKPISDFRASEEYRRNLVGVYTKRCLKRAIENGHK